MIRIVVVDLSAESRNKIVRELSSFLSLESKETSFIPRISLKPLSLQELKFHAVPEICIVGEELVATDPAQIPQIKKILPDTPLLVRTMRGGSGLNAVEQLARLGADDLMSPETGPAEFLRKVVLLARRSLKQGNGKLVLVDGGKGGVGVTSLTAALGEALLQKGKSAVLIDCDFETQDLSRFLQVRPFVNENLRLILDEQRAVSEEAVEECLSPVWQDESALMCMPPPAQSDDLYDSNSRAGQALLAVLEILDSRYACILVDMGCARGAIQKVLYRVADKVVFLVNNDPASFYASVDRIRRARSLLSAGAQLAVVENSTMRGGLGNKALRAEFNQAAQLTEADWVEGTIPFSRPGSRWPGSGASLYSQSRSSLAQALKQILMKLSLIEKREHRGIFSGLIGKLSPQPAIEGSAREALPEPQTSKPDEMAKLLQLPEPQGAEPAGVTRMLEKPAFFTKKVTPGFEEASPEKLISGAKFV